MVGGLRRRIGGVVSIASELGRITSKSNQRIEAIAYIASTEAVDGEMRCIIWTVSEAVNPNLFEIT